MVESGCDFSDDNAQIFTGMTKLVFAMVAHRLGSSKHSGQNMPWQKSFNWQKPVCIL
jgi:hypothetical protein